MSPNWRRSDSPTSVPSSLSFIRSCTTICSAPSPPGGGLQHWAMRALSASISFTDMVISVPFDWPCTFFGAGSSEGSTGAASLAASGILLSRAAIRSVLKSRFGFGGAGFFGGLCASVCLAGFSSVFFASGLGAGGFGVSAFFSSGLGGASAPARSSARPPRSARAFSPRPPSPPPAASPSACRRAVRRPWRPWCRP